ncbi:MAG TPA: tetratricopeptide repeat protein [Aggregatilinea sp.]|uniref:tetratricopeptide repeat protein n=1 Tax=Aggregatilinea sp. TaxID=2806333 RepID=UPI002B63F9C0|nr:tetratricopeptide repeat protein [Aggregatilinea sp.]HML24639.1 tetratricopeptide repeat protein [Aggregatilinea sp.]
MAEFRIGRWQIGWFEAALLIAAGIGIGLAATGSIEAVGLILLLVLIYFAWMARGVLIQAERFRPVEPPRTWMITLVANLLLMALGIGSFGWYLSGVGMRVAGPFLAFVAGTMALRWWRRGVVKKLYAWRVPALRLLQTGDYKGLVRQLEPEATAGSGHPDKLAMVALAYIELNKWQRADDLLARAKALAPDYASVNGALGSLRRHQARYAEAVVAIREALRFEESSSSRYYLGLCQYLAGDSREAERTLRAVIDIPDLVRQGQVYGAYVLGKITQERDDEAEARVWFDRMAEGGLKVIPTLEEEARRHKQTPYGETLKDHVRDMQRIIARRPLRDMPQVEENAANA